MGMQENPNAVIKGVEVAIIIYGCNSRGNMALKHRIKLPRSNQNDHGDVTIDVQKMFILIIHIKYRYGLRGWPA
jgi:hypothetical protein